MDTTKIRLLVAVGALAILGGSVRQASACGGEWIPEVTPEQRLREISRAEEAFSAGKTVSAVGTLVRMMPHIRQLDPNRAAYVARTQRMLALAAARSGGALPVQKEVPEYAWEGWDGASTGQREANLKWASQKLRKISESHQNDPASQTELAEALSKLTDTQDEARTILEKLAARDLVASPQGYAALAQLRKSAGNDQGARVAQSRCEAMASNQNICRTG